MDEQARLRTIPQRLPPATVSRSRRIDAILGRDWRVAIPFVLPVIIIMAGLILWPFINAILLSMTTRNVITRSDQFVGLDNYARLLQDFDFRTAVGNTFRFTFFSIAIKFVVGMGIALLLNSRLPLRNVLTA